MITGFDSGQHGPAVHVRHHDVEEDGAWTQSPRLLKSARAIRCRLDGEALPGQEPCQEFAGRYVVIDDEDEG
jgi:hypothetical protein